MKNSNHELIEFKSFGDDRGSLVAIEKGNNSPFEIKNDRRIAIISSLNKEVSNDGFSPSISTRIKISWNLSMRGKIANFSSDKRGIQMYGWGLTLKPGSIEEPSRWRILFDSGRINFVLIS